MCMPDQSVSMKQSRKALHTGAGFVVSPVSEMSTSGVAVFWTW